MKKEEKMTVGGHTRRLVTAALFAAICFGMTMVHVPLPMGYGNLGDCFVLLSGFLLGPLWGAAAAGLGTALADVALLWAAYAPATFVIKALMAIAAFYIAKLLSGNSDGLLKRTVSHACAAIVGEIIMIGGYFAYESVLYDVPTAIGSLVGNSMQALAGIVLATTLATVIRSNKVLERVLEGRK
jgi:uncharacterized membrane protein